MKKLLGLLLVLAMVFALAACGGGGSDTPADSPSAPPAAPSDSAPAAAPSDSAPAAAPSDSAPSDNAPSDNAPSGGSDYPWNPDNIGNHTFILAHGMPPGGMTSEQYAAFCDIVEDLSDGKMIVEQHIGGTLVVDTETLDAVMSGVADFIHSKGSFIDGTVRDISPLTVAGFYMGDDWQGFVDGLRPLLTSIYADYGIKYLGGLNEAQSVIACSTKQILQPSDVAGVAMRASGKWLSRSVDTWGGAATVVGLADLPDAFQRGTVQGVMTGWNIIVPWGIFEVAEYLTSTNITEGWACLLMNQARFDSLNPDEQALIEYAGIEFQRNSQRMAEEYVAQYKKTAEDSGRNTIMALTPEAEAEFIRLALSLFPEIIAEGILTEKGMQLIDILNEINGIT